MVEYNTLNDIFKSLANPPRRDILLRVYERQQTISELAENYQMSFAATAKHIEVLENDKLVSKRKHGKQQIVTINGWSFKQANAYLQNYAQLWDESFNKLDKILAKEKK